MSLFDLTKSIDHIIIISN